MAVADVPRNNDATSVCRRVNNPGESVPCWGPINGGLWMASYISVANNDCSIALIVGTKYESNLI